MKNFIKYSNEWYVEQHFFDPQLLSLHQEQEEILFLYMGDNHGDVTLQVYGLYFSDFSIFFNQWK